ncbi:hypothetical protein [Microbacterium sp. T2.11-28]|uniref:hypothetical protein n=1 Tax=Microbacterium sp. T2.11-28 TaxID=3041169 RepID=UPI002540913E|nr:hypothetical protein [Microbacterium sp. T2.11-28]
MTTAKTDRDRTVSNRRRAHEFRELTAYFLAHETDRPVTYRPVIRGVPRSITEELEPRSDVNGYARASILTRADYALDVSGSVRAAVEAADHDGRAFGFVIARKSGAGIADAYAMTDLRTLAHILSTLEPRP